MAIPFKFITGQHNGVIERYFRPSGDYCTASSLNIEIVGTGSEEDAIKPMWQFAPGFDNFQCFDVVPFNQFNQHGWGPFSCLFLGEHIFTLFVVGALIANDQPVICFIAFISNKTMKFVGMSIAKQEKAAKNRRLYPHEL